MTEIGIQPRPLATTNDGYRTNGYWGMVGLIVTEAALFAYLLFAYCYHAVQPQGQAWPPGGSPTLQYAIPQTIVLLISSAAIVWAERGARLGARQQQLAGLAVAFLLGAGFVALEAIEWATKTITLSSGAYGSLYFIIGGLHLSHLIIGMLVLLAVLVWLLLGYFGPARATPVSIAAIYWHFVVALWLVVFFTLYVTPRLDSL
jgi:cytochrome c oxidase subunit III